MLLLKEDLDLISMHKVVRNHLIYGLVRASPIEVEA